MQQGIRVIGKRAHPDSACYAIGAGDKAHLHQIVGELHPGCHHFSQNQDAVLGCFFVRSDQTGNGWGQLCAYAGPMGQTVFGNAEWHFSAGSHRVVETDTLDETAIAAIARVGCNDVEEWALFGASTS
jgi:hypothetical protein